MYNVIIVEDDPMVRMLNKNYIEENRSLNVTGAFGNGKEALEFLEKGNKVDLIVLDVFMPIMDGDEFLCEIRNRGYTCPVIMVTAVNEPEHYRRLTAYGVMDYLVKPFDKARFMLSLERFLKSGKIANKETGFSQEDLDEIYTGGQNEAEAQLEKGLQKKTLELVKGFLEKNVGRKLTSEIISDSIGLSRVTVRRYMNYLLEQGELDSSVNYTTGGRPSITYTYKGK